MKNIYNYKIRTQEQVLLRLQLGHRKAEKCQKLEKHKEETNSKIELLVCFFFSLFCVLYKNLSSCGGLSLEPLIPKPSGPSKKFKSRTAIASLGLVPPRGF